MVSDKGMVVVVVVVMAGMVSDKGMVVVAGMVSDKGMVVVAGMVSDKGMVVVADMVSDKGMVVVAGMVSDKGMVVVAGMVSDKGMVVVADMVSDKGMVVAADMVGDKGMVVVVVDMVGDKVGALTALQKKDWASLAAYYELEPRPTLTKTQLQKLVLEHRMEEEILDRNEVQEQFPSSSGDTEETRLSLERETVKLEILREQNKAKELSYISNRDKYVPRFDEGQPETFFSQFDKNAAIHRWPPGTGEAQRAYAGLSMDESLDYATVKSTILRVYKRVPAYYRKIFRTSQKRASQTCVEFYNEKLAQCQRLVDSAQVEENYQKLLELIVYEEVKSCMPEQFQSYLEGLGKHDLEAAGPASDHYLLTYPHVNFRNKLPLNQSYLKVESNSSGPREPAALSPLQGCPRFAPMSSGSVSPDESFQPSHPITILRDSGSVRTFVLREVISSFPQCQTGHSFVVANPTPESSIVSDSLSPEFSLAEFFNSASQESNVPDPTSSSEPVIRSIADMAVTRTTLIAEQAKDPSLRICFDHAVNGSPDVVESDLIECSHHLVPNDHEEERADVVVEPVLRNSEVLKNPAEKLAHLQEEQAASIVHLFQEHIALFSDSPSLNPVMS
ncbi:hypothetical protein Pcinc_007732 [Petrolisthes cinctipes]|uniref:Uncharacterized protein n=1 Tax=Petrolisthes cinctipes TaxID=88211 RepID=A0AAE1KWM0_PETCI|nr:hypothetical protein Pcinc_007732 [Petrolisthes cinctipes]